MNEIKVRPRWARRKHDRPGEIMSAALELFAEKGFSATRLSDVAEHAGVSKGTVYLYFDDKEDLFCKVVEADIVSHIELFEDMIKAHRGPVAPLLRSIMEQIGNLIADTHLGVVPKIVISEAGNFPSLAAFYRDNVVKRTFGLFRDLIEKGIKAGEFRDVPPSDAARAMVAPFFFMAIVTNLPGFANALELEPAKHVETALDIFFEGMVVESK